MNTEDFIDKFNALIDDVKGIKQSVKKIDELVDGFKGLQKENEVLKKRIVELEKEKEDNARRLQEIEQYSRRNNLIITGIPKEPNENLRAKIIKLAEKLNVKVYEYDICTTHRLSNKGDAPAVIVKMNNRDKKNQIIKEGRKNQPKCRDIGYNSEERIYCSEHLTKETNDLLWAAKEKLKATGFVKFVWPSEGHILTRVDENSRVIKIENMKHLQEITETFQQQTESEEGGEEKEERNGNEEVEEGVCRVSTQNQTQKIKKKNGKKCKTGNSSQEDHSQRNQQTPITSYMTRNKQPYKKQTNYR